MFGKALIPNHRKIPIFDFVAPCTLEEEFPPSSYLRKAATLAVSNREIATISFSVFSLFSSDVCNESCKLMPAFQTLVLVASCDLFILSSASAL